MRRIFRLQLLIEFFLILVKIFWWNFRSFLRNKVKDFPERISIVIKFWFDNVQFLNPINEESFALLIDFRGFLENPRVLIELIVRIWYSSTTFTFALSASLPLPQPSITRIDFGWTIHLTFQNWRSFDTLALSSHHLWCSTWEYYKEWFSFIRI